MLCHKKWKHGLDILLHSQSEWPTLFRRHRSQKQVFFTIKFPVIQAYNKEEFSHSHAANACTFAIRCNSVCDQINFASFVWPCKIFYSK